ncbi:MAG: hypothetical protein NVS3B5_05320 [Sphingomicrobium sp.]
MLRYAQLALMIFLLALSACDRAPDDDNPRSATGTTADNKLSGKPRRQTTPAPRHALASAYELQGSGGKRRVFQTKQKCEAARTTLVEAQAKEDTKLGDQGILFPDRPVLVCFPL